MAARASTENPGFHVERFWIDYKFAGTPLRMRVGADLWNVDQAGIVGDDDPRFALFVEFGNFDVMAAAVIQYESQRLGLENDNDFIYYTFSAGYNLRPHRFQLDVVYLRDRFAGADLVDFPAPRGTASGSRGRRTTVCCSWPVGVGMLGPVRAPVPGQWDRRAGARRHGGITRIPDRCRSGAYDILAGAAVAYAEVDLGIVRPFVGVIFGTPDGDPTDRQLRGFAQASGRT